jgi:hypothetical protein
VMSLDVFVVAHALGHDLGHGAGWIFGRKVAADKRETVAQSCFAVLDNLKCQRNLRYNLMQKLWRGKIR